MTAYRQPTNGDELMAILAVEQKKCQQRILEHGEVVQGGQGGQGGMCPRIWDEVMCWEPALPDEILTQPCPYYITGFILTANASKQCTSSGTWLMKDSRPWTNYTSCLYSNEVTLMVANPQLNSTTMSEFLPIINTVSNLGYGISLGTLLIAFVMLASLKRLRCPRNLLHLHLFFSFIMRAAVDFLKNSLFYQGVGLKSDFVSVNGTEIYSDNPSENWECKLISCLWTYFLMANYSWILMEGLYIYNLIVYSVFTESNSIMVYVLLGWGLPILFLVPWAVVRVQFENEYCWNRNNNKWIFLLIRLPIGSSVLINFVLFIVIVRVLINKLKSTIVEDTQRYWKTAKSTLVLMPLFGVHYALTLALSFAEDRKDFIEVTYLLLNQLFSSFQGSFVAILFCFLNNEVQTEMKKKWRRLAYHGRVIDNSPGHACDTYRYRLHSSCALRLCHCLCAQRHAGDSDRRNSKRTETMDFITNDSFVPSIVMDRDIRQRDICVSEAMTAETKLMDNHTPAIGLISA